MTMILKNLVSTLYLGIYLGSCSAYVEIIAAGVSSLAVVGITLYNKMGLPKVAYFHENCCTSKEIPANFNLLEELLDEKLFGQPLINKAIVRALRSHWNEEYQSDKALAMSFHGAPGCGKNYVSEIIQHALYSDGVRSPHTHYFQGRHSFPEVSKVEIYKRDLAKWITGNVTKCGKQMFIFDEVNQIPPGVLDVVKPFIDYLDSINGVSYRECIFIFMSNIAQNQINNLAFDLWQKGIAREDFKLSFFERIILKSAFNEKGGFQNSDTIKSDLIDHYIPFLPLEKPHVKACILEEFRKRGIHNPPGNLIEEALEFIDWGPEPHGVYSKTGCKRLNQKIGLLI